ncbi:MAG TPA: hypothetical protein VHF91_07995 [Acidimicrobiales bacterium]|nr:hypothetical protein [Acidimicrobiales bacterium]
MSKNRTQAPRWLLLVMGAAASISVLVPSPASAVTNPVTGVPEPSATCDFIGSGYYCAIPDADSGCTNYFFSDGGTGSICPSSW